MRLGERVSVRLTEAEGRRVGVGGRQKGEAREEGATTTGKTAARAQCQAGAEALEAVLELGAEQGESGGGLRD